MLLGKGKQLSRQNDNSGINLTMVAIFHNNNVLAGEKIVNFRRRRHTVDEIEIRQSTTVNTHVNCTIGITITRRRNGINIIKNQRIRFLNLQIQMITTSIFHFGISVIIAGTQIHNRILKNSIIPSELIVVLSEIGLKKNGGITITVTRNRSNLIRYFIIGSIGNGENRRGEALVGISHYNGVTSTAQAIRNIADSAVNPLIRIGRSAAGG